MSDSAGNLLRDIFAQEHTALFEFIDQAGCVRTDVSSVECETQTCHYAHQCAAKLSSTLVALQNACESHFEMERWAMERHGSAGHLLRHLEAHGGLMGRLRSVQMYAQSTKDMRGTVEEVRRFARELSLHIDTLDAEMGREIPQDVTLESIRNGA